MGHSSTNPAQHPESGASHAPDRVDVPDEPSGRGHRSGGLSLALAALGIVYGDIGTSPLYAVKECFYGDHSVRPTPDNVLGVLSLIVWSLIAVVTVKYLAFIMRADNKGEGGIFALLALIPAGSDVRTRGSR